MSGVKVVVRNAAGDLVELGRFLNRSGWEVSQKAEEGEVGMSTLYMDDLDESVWDTLGINDGARRQIRLQDMDSNKIVHFGYTGIRKIRRRYDRYGGPLRRAWSIDIWDPNSILQRRVLHHKAANRRRETDVERINALIGMPEWDLIHQFLVASTPTVTMSKNDYRGMTVGQYIADCAQMARKNHWVDMVDLGEGDGEELTFWYGRDNRDEYASTLSISNDLADIDLAALRAGTATTYFPSKDTEYQMDPARVWAGVWASGEKDAIYRNRNTTGTMFERWDTAQQWPTVHELDRLKAKAESFLDRFDEEQEIIETAILVPSDMAHLVRAGMRIPLKLTHIPTLTEFTDCRILARGLSPRGDGRRYTIPLTLEPIGPSDPYIDPDPEPDDECPYEGTIEGLSDHIPGGYDSVGSVCFEDDTTYNYVITASSTDPGAYAWGFYLDLTPGVSVGGIFTVFPADGPSTGISGSFTTPPGGSVTGHRYYFRANHADSTHFAGGRSFSVTFSFEPA